MTFGSSSYGSVAYGGLIDEEAPSVIINQFQTMNLGADLYNGTLL